MRVDSSYVGEFGDRMLRHRIVEAATWNVMLQPAAISGGGLAGEHFELDSRFGLEAGRCVGELAEPAPLGRFFDKASAWPDRRLRVIALAEDGGLARAALVTPMACSTCVPMVRHAGRHASMRATSSARTVTVDRTSRAPWLPPTASPLEHCCQRSVA